MLTDILTNMISLPGGHIVINASAGENAMFNPMEKQAQSVKLESFLLGRYPVTRQIWEAVMGFNPSFCPACLDCPVEHVSWNDVQMFLKRLNEQNELIFRLPSVAEWEYAANGGNSENAFRFSGSDAIDEVAWYSHNSGMCTRPVGRKKPNTLGFYDMCGNVGEWCADLFVPEPPPGSLRYEDPTDYIERCRAFSDDNEIYRALKGGDWQSKAESCTIAHTGGLPTGMRHHAAGFRLAATI